MLLQNNISRNYHYYDQDDTFPWVCVLKYVSNSNRCHRHLEFYIFDVQKFPYLSKYKYQQSFLKKTSRNLCETMNEEDISFLKKTSRNLCVTIYEVNILKKKKLQEIFVKLL